MFDSRADRKALASRDTTGKRAADGDPGKLSGRESLAQEEEETTEESDREKWAGEVEQTDTESHAGEKDCDKSGGAESQYCRRGVHEETKSTPPGPSLATPREVIAPQRGDQTNSRTRSHFPPGRSDAKPPE